MASEELMRRVAKLRFVDGVTSESITKVLVAEGIFTNLKDTRPIQALLRETGKWLLDEQKKLADIRRGNRVQQKLARDLRVAFGLQDARVVSGGHAKTDFDYAAMSRRHGLAAAAYLDEIVAVAEFNGVSLNVLVSGGQTILDVVNNLSERTRSDVYFYASALIGRGTITSHVGSETCATIAWARSGRLVDHLCYGTVQPYRFGQEDFEGVNKMELHNWACKQIKEQMNKMASSNKDILATMSKDIDVAIAGLGVMDPNSHDRMSMTGLLEPLGIDRGILKRQGARGDLSYCIFNDDGGGDPRWEFFITAGHGTDHSGLEFYRNMVSQGRTVIVTAGWKKKDAIRIAMEAKLFNVLVTDTYTATMLLAEASQ